ncbi:MAG: thiol peroxidase [Deltaproteobacteria bacterium]
MKEREGLVTMKGNGIVLMGEDVQPGQKAPDFTCVDNDLNPKTLADYAGRTIILSSVPSLDTPVCDMETRRFNKEAEILAESVVILTISVDLPFAQKRWCGAAGVDRVITLSDHRDTSFGIAYGVLIKDLRLLARAVFIVDAKGIVRYKQLVPEIAQEPDYEDVLRVLKDIV